jgi:hypothetical protein
MVMLGSTTGGGDMGPGTSYQPAEQSTPAGSPPLSEPDDDLPF